jgi:hypothetical protein
MRTNGFSRVQVYCVFIFFYYLRAGPPTERAAAGRCDHALYSPRLAYHWPAEQYPKQQVCTCAFYHTCPLTTRE